MLNHDQATEVREQKRIARKYKILGYDVLERPRAGMLPDFMHGMAPDIIARSPFDNVVIEVKNRASLEGSNDLVGLAARVSGRPDWRFELVVIDDPETKPPINLDSERERLLHKVRAATQARLFDVAYVYLSEILVAAARDLAARHKIKFQDKADKTLLLDLGFRGVVPPELLDRCIATLSRRNTLAHGADDENGPSEADLVSLLGLYEQLRQLS